MQYKSSCEVPNSAICARLNELSEIVKQRPLPEHEFSMRVPAELDRDADLVLSIAAQRIAALEESERRLRAVLEQIATDIAIGAPTMRHLAQCAITAGIEVK